MKKSFFLPIFLLAVVVLGISSFIGEANAATYYVSTSGSDNNNGSQSSPFRTPSYAASIVNPGDSVIIENGTYSPFTISRSGSSGAPITFESQNKWGAVIDAGGGSYAVAISASYINIMNFRMQNIAYDGIVGRDGIHDITIYGNNIGPVGANGTGNNGCAGIDFDFASNIIVDSNVVHDSGGGSDGYSADHGIDFEGQAGSTGAFSNLTVINNVTYDNDRGWDIQIYDNSHANPTVTGLYIIGNTFASTNPNNTGQLGLYMPMTNALVEDNIFYMPGGGAASYPSGQSFTASYNLTTASTMGADASGTGNILNASPSSIFADAAALDFYLQSSSPAIGTGTAWSGRTYDANGNPLANPPDIGAYEFSTSTSTSTSTSGSISTSTSTSGSTSSTSGSGGTSTSTTTSTTSTPTTGTTTTYTSTTGTTSMISGTSSTAGATSTSGTASTSTTTGSTSTTSSYGSTPAISNASTATTAPASTTSSGQVTAPQLLTPSQGQTVSTTVTFQWSPSKDSAPVTYTLYVGKKPDFSDASPIQVASAQNSMYAMGGGAAALFMFGLVVPGGIRRRRRLLMLLLAGVMAAGLLASCGGGGAGTQTSSSSPASSVSPSTGALSYTVSGLSSKTTYYWKVVAQDNAGNTVQSQTGSFQTN